MREKSTADTNNIREMNIKTDLGRVCEIWLKEVKRAHLLICDKFWDSRLSAFIKETQSDAKERYIYKEKGAIKGFITAGILNNKDYIFDLYVESQFQHRGIGRELLYKLQKNHSELSLHVYEQNFKAIEFYGKNGFKKDPHKHLCPHTGFPKLKMKWEKP